MSQDAKLSFTLGTIERLTAEQISQQIPAPARPAEMLYKELQSIEVSSGITTTVQGDADQKQVIKSLRQFFSRKKELEITISPHKSDPNKIVLVRQR